MRLNPHFQKLPAGYLFPEIGRRVRAFAAAHPEAKVIRLCIGDVTEPLVPAIIAAMHAAVDEMAVRESFKGYGPEQGYAFLVDAISEHDYRSRGVEVAPDEIFVSDGSKCDSGNLQELFAADAVIAVADPVYPVYVDSNVMAGRTGVPGPDGRYPGLVYLPSGPADGFCPQPPDRGADVVYLCSPNNPTGTVLTEDELEMVARLAGEHGLFVIGDEVYREDGDEGRHTSVRAIPGLERRAILVDSVSKRYSACGARIGCLVSRHPDVVAAAIRFAQGRLCPPVAEQRFEERLSALKRGG